MKIDWKGIAKAAGDLLKRRSPEILTGLGIAGMGVSVFLAVKATPKAIKALEADGKDTHKPIEVVKTTWRYYVPAAVTFGASVSCIVFASQTNFRRNAALAAAYTTTESMFREYKDAAKDVVGQKTEEKIHNKAAENSVQNNPPTAMNTFLPVKWTLLCHDVWGGRYFYYDTDLIKRAIEDLSYQLREEDFVTLNEFYDLINQERTKGGEVFLWRADKGPIRDNFTWTTVDGAPCLEIDFNRPPTDKHPFL